METIALYVVAATLGSMVFFAAGIAPTVFQSLPEAEAGQFLRRLFPRYYLALILGAGSRRALLCHDFATGCRDLFHYRRLYWLGAASFGAAH